MIAMRFTGYNFKIIVTALILAFCYKLVMEKVWQFSCVSRIINKRIKNKRSRVWMKR